MDSNAFMLGSLGLIYATVFNLASAAQTRRRRTSASLATA
jgi:hypothetical protein